jgi:hypothetical protein
VCTDQVWVPACVHQGLVFLLGWNSGVLSFLRGFLFIAQIFPFVVFASVKSVFAVLVSARGLSPAREASAPSAFRPVWLSRH